MGSADWTIVFVLGAPGGGKGTQCARIVEKYGWKHLSTGDLLRGEVAAGTPLGLEAQAIMEAGEMVPTSLVLDLLSNAMSSSGASRFLVDGFPRKLDQLEEFEAKIQKADYVLVFTLPEDVAVSRLIKRGETSGRADDNEDTIRSRMQVFDAESKPVIDMLKESGRVAEIDSSADVDSVFESVGQIMDTLELAAAEKEAAAAAATKDQQETIDAPAEPSDLQQQEEAVEAPAEDPAAAVGVEDAAVDQQEEATADAVDDEAVAPEASANHDAAETDEPVAGEEEAPSADPADESVTPEAVDESEEAAPPPVEEAVEAVEEPVELVEAPVDAEEPVESAGEAVEAVEEAVRAEEPGATDEAVTAVEEPEAAEEAAGTEEAAPAEEPAADAIEDDAAAEEQSVPQDSDDMVVLGESAYVTEEVVAAAEDTGDDAEGDATADTTQDEPEPEPEPEPEEEQQPEAEAVAQEETQEQNGDAAAAVDAAADGAAESEEALPEADADVAQDAPVAEELEEPLAAASDEVPPQEQEEVVAESAPDADAAADAPEVAQDDAAGGEEGLVEESAAGEDAVQEQQQAEQTQQAAEEDAGEITFSTGLQEVLNTANTQDMEAAAGAVAEISAERAIEEQQEQQQQDVAVDSVRPVTQVELSPDCKVVFVLGAPGAGKGTQCARIVEDYGWKHMSTGDLLRAEVAKGSDLGNAAAEIMRGGGFVPTSMILDLLSNAMSSSGASRFLVDGFPRKLDQLEEFEAKVRPADYVLVFTLPEDVAVSRLIKRGETSGRADDNEDTIRSRMQVFWEESQPVIDSLKGTGRVAEIDSSADVDSVYAHVKQVIDGIEGREVPGDAAEPVQEMEEVPVEAVESDEVPVQAVEEVPDVAIEEIPVEDTMPEKATLQEASDEAVAEEAVVDSAPVEDTTPITQEEVTEPVEEVEVEAEVEPTETMPAADVTEEVAAINDAEAVPVVVAASRNVSVKERAAATVAEDDQPVAAAPAADAEAGAGQADEVARVASRTSSWKESAPSPVPPPASGMIPSKPSTPRDDGVDGAVGEFRRTPQPPRSPLLASRQSHLVAGELNTSPSMNRSPSNKAPAAAAAPYTLADSRSMKSQSSRAGALAAPGALSESKNVSAMPVKQYMDATVVPVLRKALRALNDARPSDPLQVISCVNAEGPVSHELPEGELDRPKAHADA